MVSLINILSDFKCLGKVWKVHNTRLLSSGNRKTCFLIRIFNHVQYIRELRFLAVFETCYRSISQKFNFSQWMETSQYFDKSSIHSWTLGSSYIHWQHLLAVLNQSLIRYVYAISILIVKVKWSIQKAFACLKPQQRINFIRLTHSFAQ